MSDNIAIVSLDAFYAIVNHKHSAQPCIAMNIFPLH